MDPTRFELSFGLTPEEEAQAVKVQNDLAHPPRPAWADMVETGILTFFILGLPVLLERWQVIAAGQTMVVSFAMLATFVIGLAPQLYRKRRAQRLLLQRQRAVPEATAPRRHVIDPDGVRIGSALFDVHWTWLAFTAVERRAGLIVLMTSVDRFVTLPARAFASAAEADALQAFARARIASGSPPD